MTQETSDNAATPEETPASQPPAVVEKEAQASRDDTPAKSGGGAGTVLGALALIGVIAAAGGGYYLWQQITALQHSLDEKSAALADSESGWQDKSAALSQELAAARTAQQTLQAEIEALAKVEDPTETAWSVTDVEYLLRIAHHRLVLQQDVNGALAALNAADARLVEIDDPRLTTVRQRIAADVTALRAVPVLDREGMALTLASLAERVDQLPLSTAQARSLQADAIAGTPLDGVPAWQQFFATVWAELKQLVVVRRQTDGAAPMLAPEQQYFLHQNLRLQLEAARVALLRGDNPNYTASLDTARDWLAAHFDGDNAGVKAAGAQLEELATAELNPTLPDISGTLGLLRERLRSPDETPDPNGGRAAL